MAPIMEVLKNNVEILVLATIVAVYLLSRMYRRVDVPLAAFAVLLFGGFIAVMIWRLPDQIDLIFFTLLVLAFAVIDFVKQIRAEWSQTPAGEREPDHHGEHGGSTT